MDGSKAELNLSPQATGVDKVIRSKGRPVGYKRALVFYAGKPGSSVKTNWLMHEYTYCRVNQRSAPSTSRAPNLMKMDNWVLCKVCKKVEKLKNGLEQGNEGTEIIIIPDEVVPNVDPKVPSSVHINDGALPDDSLDYLLDIDMSDLLNEFDFMAGEI